MENSGNEKRSYKDEFKALFSEYNASQTFRGQAKIAGIICLALITASFSYTLVTNQATLSVVREGNSELRTSITSLKDDTHQEITRLNSLVDDNETDIYGVKSEVTLVNDRYLRLINDIGKIEAKMTELIKTIRDHDDKSRGVKTYYDEMPKYDLKKN